MKNPHKSGSTPTDPHSVHLEMRMYPYRHETQAIVVLASGLGARASRLRLWSGTLPCTRADLAGLRPSDITILLTGLLRDALSAVDFDAVAPAADSESGGAIGVPLGTTGGTVIQACLPFD